MHGLPYRIISTERKTDIAHAPTDFGSFQIFFDPFSSFKEVHRIGSMLFHSRCYWEDIGVENDIIGIKLDFLSKDIVAPPADFDPPLVGIRLALFVKSHD